MICTINFQTNQVTAEAIQKCIDSLEDEQQKDFIRQCLVTDPASRPKARDLLFHPVLFEVTKFILEDGKNISEICTLHSPYLWILGRIRKFEVAVFLKRKIHRHPVIFEVVIFWKFSKHSFFRCILSNFLQLTHSSKIQVDSDFHSC